MNTYINNRKSFSSDSNLKATNSIDLPALIAETIAHWKVHRCQVTDALISQHQPMKFIYHYEHLADWVKLQHPLNGQLLATFDNNLTREQFSQILDIRLQQVAKPWQLKFTGKLVIFYHNPEVALRLYWVNTLKDFEPIYTTSKGSEAQVLSNAIDCAFNNWQICGVEVIQKNPQTILTFLTDDALKVNTILASNEFVPVPNALATDIINYLQTQTDVANEWLAIIKAEAQSFAKNNNITAVG